MTLTLRYAARSDRGLIRDGNQDSVYAGPRLLAVADGMGGMAAGDVASNIVIAALAPSRRGRPRRRPGRRAAARRRAANQQIRGRGRRQPRHGGHGHHAHRHAVSAAAKFGMVHIGDSRAYLLRDGEFVQITRDDTYVQMLVDEGRITAEEANTHPQRSLLMRALDGRDVDPEYSVRQAVAGDRYLICSDGLSGVVTDETIAATLREYADPNQCAERLVQLALRGGGPDNITVIVADVTDEDIVEEHADRRRRGRQRPGHDDLGRTRSTPGRPRLGADRSRASAGAGRGGRRARSTPTRPPAAPGPHRADRAGAAARRCSAAACGVGWRYTQSQYYVGRRPRTAQVAVFQGIPGADRRIRPVHGRRTSSDRDSVDELTRSRRSGCKQGIPATEPGRRPAASSPSCSTRTSKQPAADCPSPAPVRHGQPGSRRRAHPPAAVGRRRVSSASRRRAPPARPPPSTRHRDSPVAPTAARPC